MSIRPPILLLHCPEIECPYVLKLVFTEFADSFARAGHEVRHINRIEDICNDSIFLRDATKNAEGSETNVSDLPFIVFMGNGVAPNTDIFGLCQRLAHQAPRAQYIGWYWQYWRAAVEAAHLRFLYIHENGLAPIAQMAEPQMRDMLVQIPEALRCPLLLRANDSPEQIGKYERHTVRDYVYMGCPYCPEWVPDARSNFTGIYYQTRDLSKYVAYDVRRLHYLTSHFALGFQSIENIRNGHVSQRIYEGLAYGCIVLTNSWPAHEQTQGIAVYVTGREDLESKMRYFLDRPDEMARKREEGYAFVRQSGTNDHARDLLLSKIEAMIQ